MTDDELLAAGEDLVSGGVTHRHPLGHAWGMEVARRWVASVRRAQERAQAPITVTVLRAPSDDPEGDRR